MVVVLKVALPALVVVGERFSGGRLMGVAVGASEALKESWQLFLEEEFDAVIVKGNFRVCRRQKKEEKEVGGKASGARLLLDRTGHLPDPLC